MGMKISAPKGIKWDNRYIDINISYSDRGSLDSDHECCQGKTPLLTVNQAERHLQHWAAIHYYLN
jgi:hypothetical protein